MSRSSTALIIVGFYGVLVLCISVWSARRNHGAQDFFLAARKLGWLTAGLGAAAGTLSGAALIGLSSAAYNWGLAAGWIAVAFLGGAIVNWIYVAPRLRALALVHSSLSLTQVFAHDAGDRMYRKVAWSAAFIVVVALLLAASAELRIAATVLERNFHWPLSTVLTVAVAVVLAYTAIGGLLSISLLGTVQSIILVLLALVLAVCALIVIGGPSAFVHELRDMQASGADWVNARGGVVALAFVLGTLGPGLGSPGQIQVVHRFMAIKDAAVVQRAGIIALVWMMFVLSAALLIGWCARSLVPELGGIDPVSAVASRLLPPVLATFATVALSISAISAVDALLLLLTAAVAVDLRAPPAQPSLEFARLLMPLLAIAIALLTLYVPQNVSERLAFATNALGAAFGPLVLVRLAGKRVRAGSMLGAMWAGVSLTAIFHAMPNAPGDFLECMLPFVASLGIALTGGERRHNPDRADRGATTVHDRMPI